MRRQLIGLGLFLLFVPAAQAAIIAQYTAPGGSFDPTTVAARVTASSLNDTGSSADLEPGASLANSVFLEQGILSTNAAQAVANNQFFQFNVAAAAGARLNLSSLTFDAARGGPSTPRGWVVRSSLDGFGADIATADIPTQQPTLTAFNVDLTGSLFQNVATDVTFRIYGYAPTTGGAGSFYDNITLNGSVLEPTLVQYTAPGGSFLPTTVADNVLASALNDIDSSADLEAGASLPNTVFLEQGIVSTNAAQAVANDQFFQFTASPLAGYELDLLSLSFDVSRGGPSTPRGWVLRSSLDGFGADIATADIPTQQPNLTAFNVDLSGDAFQNLTSQVTFRLYGYAPTAGGAGSFYDNLTLRGTSQLQVVPEPASLLLLGAGLAGVLSRGRRRKA